jgi:hypothetical protein
LPGRGDAGTPEVCLPPSRADWTSDRAAGAAGAGAAGAGDVRGAGVAGAGAALAAGAAGAWAAGAGAAGAGAGADGVCAAGAAGAASAAGGAAAAGAAGAGVALAGEGLAPAERFSAGNVSVALRTTGASMVELAVLTYSPMLLRWAISVLLSVPSSLASALTRTLATFLLFLVRARTGADRRYCWGELIAEFSSGAHQRQTRFRFP